MLKEILLLGLISTVALAASKDVEITAEDSGVMLGTWVTPDGFNPDVSVAAVVLLADANHVDTLELDWAKDLADRNGWPVLATSPWTKEEVAELKDGTPGTAILNRYMSNVEMSQLRYKAIIDFVKSQPGVDGEKIVAAGFCFGGWGTLELARMNVPGVVGLVSIHGAFRPGSAAPEKINARVLILHGADDQKTNTVENIGSELKAAGATYETTTFGFVLHSYTNPLAGYKTGGYSAYNPYAAKRAYKSTENFFIDVINPDGAPYTYSVAAEQLDTLVEEAVTYQDGDTELKGFIYYKKSAVGPMPGVVVSHAWGGLHEHEKNVAQRLALNGYVGFAHSVYTPEETASAANPFDFATRSALVGKYANDMPLYKSRMHSAIKFLGAHSMVDDKKIAVSGYCFGGGSALIALNLNLPNVLGAVAFHGSLNAKIDEMETPLSSRVLILHGVDDANINDGPRGSNSMVQPALEAKLNEHEANWELTKYSNTGHGFTEPTSRDYNIISDRRSFVSFLDFLEKLFMDRVCFHQARICSADTMITQQLAGTPSSCTCGPECISSNTCCENYYTDCVYYNKLPQKQVDDGKCQQWSAWCNTGNRWMEDNCSDFCKNQKPVDSCVIWSPFCNKGNDWMLKHCKGTCSAV